VGRLDHDDRLAFKPRLCRFLAIFRLSGLPNVRTNARIKPSEPRFLQIDFFL
jgi:hypothetical protein